jgi:hypothetical protein
MITQTATASFLEELLLGIHDFSTDIFKIALYTTPADIGLNTTAYTALNETTGVGYTAGGLTLTGTAVLASDGVAFIAFDNAVWNPGVFTARGGLIYNSSKGNRSVAVLNFGDDKTSTSSFSVQMPPATATTALIRITKGA